MMKEIKLTKGKIAMIDDGNYELVSQYKWYYMGCGYAATRPWNKNTKTYRTIYMHRLIMGHPVKKVDHINRNKLDNRRDNLRLCSHRENIRNGKVRSNNTSGHRGVYLHHDKKRWTARITVNYKYIYLGLFEQKEEAINSYDQAAKYYFKDFSPNTVRNEL